MTISPNVLESTFNHVVLPPKLPGKQDDRVEDVEADLLSRLQNALKTVKSSLEDDDLAIWKAIESSLHTCGLVNEDRYVNKVELLQAFQGLKAQHAIIIRILEQNAGLIIRHTGYEAAIS